jgi:hypothetical protein
MALIDKLNAIGDAIRAKTGKSDKLTLDQMPLEIESITGGGGSSIVDIIPEQELAFTFDETNGVHILMGNNLYNITDIIAGKEYKVVWGTNEFSCTAFESTFFGYPCIAIGNTVSLGGADNNIPFTILHVVSDDPEVNKVCYVIGLDGLSTKNVHVYQEASGGVQDDRVKYVTFIGLGGVELYRQPVIVGDTCHNPVAKGYIETPTKESTTTQVFPYAGWSLTEGGSASSSALANVTEDRTVYVAFKEEVRKYTVRFYDGETLLTTKQVEYGGTATHEVTKENHLLSGWNPDPTNVTEDMDCYAVWMESQAFSVASWDFITTAVNAGQAANIWSVGDEKDISLAWSDGTTETCTLQIASFDDDGTEQNGKPFITLISKGLLSKTSNITTSKNKEYAYRGADCTKNAIYTFLNDTVKPALPSDLQAAMKGVKLKYEFTGTYVYEVQYPDILIPTVANVGIKDWRSGAWNSNNSPQYLVTDNTYPLFDNTTHSKRIKSTPDGTAQTWWVSDSGLDPTSATKYVVSVKTDGTASTASDYATAKHVCIKLFV